VTTEAEESALLEAVANERLVKTAGLKRLYSSPAVICKVRDSLKLL
jgi:hypothetical protein